MDDRRTDGKPKQSPSREERLAEALRANLRRRKEAARTAAKPEDGETSTGREG